MRSRSSYGGDEGGWLRARAAQPHGAGAAALPARLLRGTRLGCWAIASCRTRSCYERSGGVSSRLPGCCTVFRMCPCPGELSADGILGGWFGAGGGSLCSRRGGAGAARRVRGPGCCAGATESRQPLSAHRGEGRIALLGFTQWRGVGRNLLDNFWKIPCSQVYRSFLAATAKDRFVAV